MNAPDRVALRLTPLSHGGGCGGKVAPVWRELIAQGDAGLVPKACRAGIETAANPATIRR